MNRELKFRAWNIKSKSMAYDFWLNNDEEYGVSVYDAVLGGREPTPCKHAMILMQYTGLKDKNGKEIYEGDIVQYPAMDYDPSNGDSLYEFGEIRYKNAAFLIDQYLLREHEKNDIELIGNIYQNPELLK